jgi:hypothetical protein
MLKHWHLGSVIDAFYDVRRLNFLCHYSATAIICPHYFYYLNKSIYRKEICMKRWPDPTLICTRRMMSGYFLGRRYNVYCFIKAAQALISIISAIYLCLLQSFKIISYSKDMGISRPKICPGKWLFVSMFCDHQRTLF